MKWIGIVSLLVVMSGCSEQGAVDLPFYQSADLTPEWIEEGDSAYLSIHTIGEFQLTDQDGVKFGRTDMDGKVCVVNFFFTTCPGLCPKMTANLLPVQKRFVDDKDVLLISHTVMPWVDGVDQLRAHADEKGIVSDRWKLLTGPKEIIYTLARGEYFADEGFGKSVTLTEEFLHTENVFLIDAQGRIRGVYNGTVPLDMNRMMEDMMVLKKSNDRGK